MSLWLGVVKAGSAQPETSFARSLNWFEDAAKPSNFADRRLGPRSRATTQYPIRQPIDETSLVGRRVRRLPLPRTREVAHLSRRKWPDSVVETQIFWSLAIACPSLIDTRNNQTVDYRMIGGLYGDELHRRPLHRFGDCLRIPEGHSFVPWNRVTRTSPASAEHRNQAPELATENNSEKENGPIRWPGIIGVPDGFIFLVRVTEKEAISNSPPPPTGPSGGQFVPFAVLVAILIVGRRCGDHSVDFE